MIKKSTILFLTSAIILFSELANAQFLPFYGNKKTSNALAMMELNGKVKSMEQKVFIASDSLGKIIKGARKYENNNSVNTDFLIQFDITGRAIKEIYYSEKFSSTAYHYYDNIKNTETVEEQYSTNQPGKINYRTIYKYNKEGKIIYNYVDGSLMDFDELRSQIGFVTQDTNLFAGTIKENLIFVIRLLQ